MNECWAVYVDIGGVFASASACHTHNICAHILYYYIYIPSAAQGGSAGAHTHSNQIYLTYPIKSIRVEIVSVCESVFVRNVHVRRLVLFVHCCRCWLASFVMDMRIK